VRTALQRATAASAEAPIRSAGSGVSGTWRGLVGVGSSGRLLRRGHGGGGRALVVGGRCPRRGDGRLPGGTEPLRDRQRVLVKPPGLLGGVEGHPDRGVNLSPERPLIGHGLRVQAPRMPPADPQEPATRSGLQENVGSTTPGIDPVPQFPCEEDRARRNVRPRQRDIRQRLRFLNRHRAHGGYRHHRGGDHGRGRLKRRLGLGLGLRLRRGDRRRLGWFGITARSEQGGLGGRWLPITAAGDGHQSISCLMSSRPNT
jgi:hypothetical protein